MKKIRQKYPNAMNALLWDIDLLILTDECIKERIKEERESLPRPGEVEKTS